MKKQHENALTVIETLAPAPDPQLTAQANEVLVWAQSLTITTQAEYEQAVDKIRLANQLRERIKAVFRPLASAADKLHAAILRVMNNQDGPVVEGVKLAKVKLGEWVYEQDRLRDLERRRIEEELRAALAAQESEIIEEDPFDVIDEADRNALVGAAAAAEVIPAPKVRGVAVSHPWRYRVRDVSQINRDFLMIDEKKIAKAVSLLGKTAEEVVGGIEAYQEIAVSIRKE